MATVFTPLTDVVCKCLSLSSARVNEEKQMGLEEFSENGDSRYRLEAPKAAGFISYTTAHDQPLRGIPIREGDLWFLTADGDCEKISFSLYINGFSFISRGKEYTFALSPFSLVRFCRLQDGSILKSPHVKIFKVSLFARGFCYYFGVEGADDRLANEERSRWVLDISHAMRLVTQSIFPAFKVTCDAPLKGSPESSKLLLAGYLIHHDDETASSVLFCELLAPSGSHAKLVAYDNEGRMLHAFDIPIDGNTACSEKVGINCSCFCIDDHHFSARSLSERKLWLRALSNVKVKIHNQAPIPTSEDLEHYRVAVREQINSMTATLDRNMHCDPLLMRSARRHFHVVGNGDTDPLPLRTPDLLPMVGAQADQPPATPRDILLKEGEEGHGSDATTKASNGVSQSVSP
jgi:hypothetical protein